MHMHRGGEIFVIIGTAEALNLNWIDFINGIKPSNAELHPEEDCRSLSEVLSLISGPECKSTLSYRVVFLTVPPNFQYQNDK